MSMPESGISYEEKMKAAVADQKRLNRREAIRQSTVNALKLSTAVSAGAHVGAELANVRNKITKENRTVSPQGNKLLESMAATSAISTASLVHLEGDDVKRTVGRRNLVKSLFIGLLGKHINQNRNKEK